MLCWQERGKRTTEGQVTWACREGQEGSLHTCLGSQRLKTATPPTHAIKTNERVQLSRLNTDLTTLRNKINGRTHLHLLWHLPLFHTQLRRCPAMLPKPPPPPPPMTNPVSPVQKPAQGSSDTAAQSHCMTTAHRNSSRRGHPFASCRKSKYKRVFWESCSWTSLSPL